MSSRGLEVPHVQHLAPDFVSHLPELLAHNSGYAVSSGQDGEEIETGHAYIAPANRHMTVDAAGRIRLHETARIHFTRPSVDVLFCSLAPVYKNRVIAVVLTGGGTDGTEGARVIRQNGGIVIVQSAASSEHFGMPGSVIERGHADYVLPLWQIPQRIIELSAIVHG
jgi:two-component system chemotaxis response regulator CheB